MGDRMRISVIPHCHIWGAAMDLEGGPISACAPDRSPFHSHFPSTPGVFRPHTASPARLPCAYAGRMLAAVARVGLAAGLALCERVCACAARRGCDDVTARARTDGLFARARPAPCLLGSPAAGDVDRLRGRGCPPRARSRERPTRAYGNAATCKGWVRCPGLEPTRRNGRSLSRSRRHRYISSHSPSLLLCSPPPPAHAFCCFLLLASPNNQPWVSSTLSLYVLAYPDLA